MDLVLSDPGVEKLTEVLGCAYLGNFAKRDYAKFAVVSRRIIFLLRICKNPHREIALTLFVTNSTVHERMDCEDNLKFVYFNW